VAGITAGTMAGIAAGIMVVDITAATVGTADCALFSRRSSSFSLLART
jgi:hypothetical protein